MDAVAVASLDRLKTRKPGQGYIAVAGSGALFQGWYAPDLTVQRLLKLRFDGPVTLICAAGAGAPATARAENGTIALRVDAHPAVSELTEALAGPILSTSLNLPGQTPADSPHELASELVDALHGVFDRPPRPTGTASTMIAWRPPELIMLRAGRVSLAEIRRRLAGMQPC